MPEEEIKIIVADRYRGQSENIKSIETSQRELYRVSVWLVRLWLILTLLSIMIPTLICILAIIFSTFSLGIVDTIIRNLNLY